MKTNNTIISITELGDSWYGYELKTVGDIYKIMLDAETQCCEESGMIVCEDDLKSIIGDELISIEEIHDNVIHEQEVEDSISDKEDAAIMFININTDKDTVQLSFYNAHNGYYGHYGYITKNGELLAPKYYL